MAHSDEQFDDYFPCEDVTFMAETATSLRQVNQMLRGTLEVAPEMIAVQDNAARYLALNSAYHAEFQKIFGVDLKIGTNMIAALARLPEEQQAATEIFERMIAGEAFTVIHEFGDHRLARRYYELHCFPLRDSAGRVIGGTHIARDVTEERRTEEALRASEGNYQRMIDSSPDCIKVLDLEGRVLSINPGGRSLMELEEDLGHYLGSSWLDYWQGEARQRAALALERARSGGVGRFCAPGTTITGQIKWWDETLSPMLDASGQTERLLVVARDITQQKQAEDELRRSEERFRQLINNLPVAVYTTDAAGRVTLYNEQAAVLWGRRPELGQDLWCGSLRMYGTDGTPIPLDQCPMASALRQGKPVKGQEIIVERPDGSRRDVMPYPEPIRDAAGQIVGAVNVLMDITAIRQAEEASQRFRIALDSAADNIFLIDPQTMRYLDVNQSACRDLGYSREELLQRGPLEVMPRICQEELQRCFAEIRADPSGRVALETIHYRKDGTGFAVEVILRPVENQSRPLLVAVARDITERKQAEEALRTANAQLAEADRRKNEFLAMLAHELRNPLAPIRNAMQVLRMIDLNEPAQKRQGDIIDRQISHMARLVNDLLDVSRITRGKIELSRQPLALADVLHPAVETAMPLIETRHQSLIITSPSPALRVLADPGRLAQVVGNLLTNAAKYTEEGGRIWLEAGREGGEAVIRVRDTGVGIAPELLPHIFDLFTQAEQSLARSQGGLGIGLTMVRSLVEMHGGRVEAYSVGLGQGSEFTVRLAALADESRSAAA